MIIQGDCLEVLRSMPDNSVDSICTDPPYGISFMSKKWDYDVPSIDVWRECLRVLKPGGHMLVACGTRTQHRMVAPIEDAGFEIRDVITWLYGSGMPKSLNVGKATGQPEHAGLGSALKPAVEFWTLCRKPLSESTIAKNVLKWGTGAINVDGCRVGTTDAKGRFPANLILDEEAAAALDAQSGIARPKSAKTGIKGGSAIHGGGCKPTAIGHWPADEGGGASRFFYQAKSSKSDRGAGNNHPTCKPTTLMAYLCKLITPPGGLVLDPFAGSGSTGVGALREGFRFVGIEREAEYVAIGKSRLDAATG